MMSKSARSVFVFGLYLGVLGIALLVVPNALLGMFFLRGTTEVWVRVVGMLVLFLGFYCVMSDPLRHFRVYFSRAFSASYGVLP